MPQGASFQGITRTPVTTAADVRTLTGYDQPKDITDPQLEALILKAQALVTEDLATRFHNVQLTGALDGTNARFELPAALASRVLLDPAFAASEATTLQIQLRQIPVGNAPATYAAATVSSVDALHGQVLLSAAPDPAVYDAVLFTGFLLARPVSIDRFKVVVELLAAHLADQRIRGPGNVVLGNAAVQQKDGEAPRRSWKSLYNDELQKLKATLPRAATVRTRLPWG